MTLTSVIGPLMPLTAICDGYGAAVPEEPDAGILIRAEFVNKVPAEADAATASEMSAVTTSSRISLRGSGT